MNILITGSNGFIGKALVGSLNSESSRHNIFTYDISQLGIDPEYTKSRFMDAVRDADIIIHLGAISSTNSNDKKNIFEQNIYDTLNIFHMSKSTCKIIYASSASVYGNYFELSKFNEDLQLAPQSLYAKSKAYIDLIVKTYLNDRDIIGLRFFNVCSFTQEAHKTQPSPTFKFIQQLNDSGVIKLFHLSDQMFRDFIYIKDVIKIIKFFMTFENKSAKIVNVGSDTIVSFQSIAESLITKFNHGKIEYIPKPDSLSSSYQTYTRADISLLRSLGYTDYIPSILEYIDNLDYEYHLAVRVCDNI